MKPQGFVPASASPSAREPADLHVRKVVLVTGILIGTLGVSILALVLFFHHLNQKYPRRTSEAAPVVTSADLPPLPRLQTTPLRDLAAVRAAENSHLDQYRWIDRPRSVAQIPIDRAMILWVRSWPAAQETGIPAAAPSSSPATNAPTAGSTGLPMRQHKAQEIIHAP